MLQEIEVYGVHLSYGTRDLSRCLKVCDVFSVFCGSDTDLFCIGSLAKKASTLSIPLASLKFPPVMSLSFSSSRSKDWDDVLTTHTDETFARTWTVQNKRLGKHSFGFAEASKKKSPLGSAKVGDFLSFSFLLALTRVWNRPFASLHAAISASRAHPQEVFKCGTCNLASSVKAMSSGLVLLRLQIALALLQQKKAQAEVSQVWLQIL